MIVALALPGHVASRHFAHRVGVVFVLDTQGVGPAQDCERTLTSPAANTSSALVLQKGVHDDSVFDFERHAARARSVLGSMPSPATTPSAANSRPLLVLMTTSDLRSSRAVAVSPGTTVTPFSW